MGNSSSSFETQLRNQSLNINNLHNDIDATMTRIENEANRITDIIQQRNYTDQSGLCQQLGWQKVDELSSLLPIQTVQGIRYRLGVVAPYSEELNLTKREMCRDIVNFYLKKINLISNIQRELPKCREMENAIYQGLTRRLQSEQLDNEEWIQVYTKLENFNRDIKSRYGLFERELERIRQARTVTELDNISVTTNSILSRTNAICSNYENDLLPYSRRREVLVGAVPEGQIFRPLPEEPTMTTLIDTENPRIITSSPNQRTVTQIQRPTRQLPIPIETLAPPNMEPIQVSPPTQIVYERPEPVTRPTVIQTVQLPQRITRPTRPLPVTPITQTVYRRPEPVMISQPPITTYQPTINQEPLLPAETPNHVYRKQVTVQGDRIRYEPGRTVVENPIKVDIERSVSPEYAATVIDSLRPQEKIVTIEPEEVEEAIAVSFPPTYRKTTPARAIADHIPVTNSEVPLRAGELVNHIRTFENYNGRWSYIQKNNGQQGYVPNSYLKF